MARWQASGIVPESRLEPTEHGLVPNGNGWFVLTAREARWYHGPGRSAICEFEGEFEGEQDFLQLGINLSFLRPGVPMAMYHWEADQEDFLVLSGEALLIVEGEERPLRQWDLVHCPAGTKHVIVGAGEAPCLVLAVGARDRSIGPDLAATAWTRPCSVTARASSSPAGTKHVVVGAGDTPCVVLAVGARDRSTGPDSGGYTVDEAALRHNAGVEQETTDQFVAYGRVPRREHTRYREGWLPD